MSQTVTVEALMGQRYKGQHHGRGDRFEMSEGDAADAEAVNFVKRVKAPTLQPEAKNQLPVVTRDMPPEGKKPVDGDDEEQRQQSSETGAGEAKPAAPAATSLPAVAGRHGGNQQPYQNRNTHTRNSGNRR